MHTYVHIYLCCIDHVVCIYVVYFLEDLISTNKVCTLHALHMYVHTLLMSSSHNPLASVRRLAILSRFCQDQH